MEVASYCYAVEKLTNTLECLATHPGDARERLTSAYLTFHTLNEDNFPQKYQKKWKSIKTEITKFGPPPDYKSIPRQGSVENTMSRIRKNTAAKIAKEIYELYWAVSKNKRYQ